jgi:DNA-binding NarL/FixJ family response regulator
MAALIELEPVTIATTGGSSPPWLASADGARESTGGAKRARILVVEDDFFIALQIETMLADAGYEILGVISTGEDAVLAAQTENPDVVLMDVRLAGRMDGVEAAGIIYKRAGIRSIFVSANIDDNFVKRSGQANPFGWVNKPFTPQRLLEALDDALSPP